MKNSLRVVVTLVSVLFAISFSACKAPSQSDLNGVTGVKSSSSSGSTSYATPQGMPSILKIFALAGTSPLGATTLAIADTLNLRAVLVDYSGGFIAEVPANWWTTGTLIAGNLTAVGQTKYATFVPSAISTGNIQASISDTTLIQQNNIVVTTTTSGAITVTTTLVADQVQIVSGNAQTGQVGANLASDVVVKVVNAGNTPIPGVTVTFAPGTGGGTIVTSPTVVSDGLGLAQATLKLGGAVGAQTFTATISSGSVPQVQISATGTVGPPASLSFYQQPGGANSSSAFSTQPLVEIRDAYGNRVTTATNTVTLAKATGTGAAGGTLVLAAVAGLVSYTNVTYSVAEAGVSLIATSPGLTSTTSSTFTVGSVTIAGQCNSTAFGWSNADGGCKDLTSGLVWSALNTAATDGTGHVVDATRTWSLAVWDFATGGSGAIEAWESARGISRDVSGVATVDASAGDYCHSLVESGMTDWRMPTLAEYQAADTHQAFNSLKNSAPGVMWTGSTMNGTTAYAYSNFTAGATGTNYNNYTIVTPYNVRCVREPPPTQLYVSQQISGLANGLGVNVKFAQQPKIAIRDGTNSPVSYATNSVTLTVTTGSGQLCVHNTATGVTNNCATSKTVAAVAGVADFNNIGGANTGLAYNAADTFTLTASATGLTSVALNPVTVNAVYPQAACATIGGGFVNGNGGCKDSTTGMIYSAKSAAGMQWHEAIWDQTVSGSSGMKASDWKGDEYWAAPNDPGVNPDVSSTSYCHDLSESNYTDWMLPVSTPLSTLTTKSPELYTYQFNSSIYFYSTQTQSGTPANVWIGNPFLATATYGLKTNGYRAVCVRSDAPAQMAFTVQPGGGVYGFGAGVPFGVQPTIDVKDSSGAGPLMMLAGNGAGYYWGHALITLTVVPASDATGGTGNLIQYSSAMAANPEQATILSEGPTVSGYVSNGRLTLANLAYSKPNEKFRLKASAVVNWRGHPVTIPDIYSNDITMPAIYSRAQCNAQAGWASQYGGCMDQGVGGLVWSGYQTSVAWDDAVWDSAVGGAQAPDSDDGAATNDYDAASAVAGKNDGTNYDVCHRLRLNGYSDWRMPTYTEMDTALKGGGRNGYTAVKNLATSTHVWSSRAAAAGTSYMFTATTGVWYSAGTPTPYNKAIQYGVVCVRPATP